VQCVYEEPEEGRMIPKLTWIICTAALLYTFGAPALFEIKSRIRYMREKAKNAPRNFV
jgi:hypothetical protein